MQYDAIPLDGASYVENPAKKLINNMASAVLYDPKLYAAYKDGSFFKTPANFMAAFDKTRSFRPIKKQLRELHAHLKHDVKITRASHPDEYEKALNKFWEAHGGRPKKAGGSKAKVTPAFKRALAAAIGRLRGYDKAVDKNSSRYRAMLAEATGKKIARHRDGSEYVKGYKFGSTKGKKMEGMLKRIAAETESRSSSAEKNAKIRELIKSSGKSNWWTDDNALSAYKSWKKGRRNSEPLTREQADARMYGRFMTPGQTIEQMFEMQGGAARKRNYTPRGPKSAQAASRRSAQATKAAEAAGDNFREGRYSALASNPFSGLSDYELGALALSNPSGVGFLDSIESAVEGLPGGHIFGPMVTPMVAVGAAVAANTVLTPMLATYLPESLQSYARAISGTAIGAAVAAVGLSQDNANTRNALLVAGGAISALGIAQDVMARFTGDSATAGLALSGISDEGMGALALSGLGDSDMGALALSGSPSLGDGGAYQVQTLGFAGDHNAIQSMYADARPIDAHYSGPDLDAVEGEAVLGGASTYLGTFGAAPLRAAGPRRAQSRHAGLRGHRWGWLIQAVGFDQFQKIAALPPEQRVSVIKQFREQATATAQRLVDEARASATAASPAPAPSALGGYGATLFSGGGF